MARCPAASGRAHAVELRALCPLCDACREARLMSMHPRRRAAITT